MHPVAYQQSVEEIPAVEAPEAVHPLDMSTALALVAGKNPQVAYSQSRIREAYANLQAANVLWLPTIQTGVSYNHHEGNLQDSTGAILDVSRSSLQAGLGAGAVGAGTTTQPGIVAQFHLVDALFQPKIAERNVWAQQHANDAVLNDQLLEAAVAYQELLRAYQLQAIANETVAGSEKLVRLTTDFAKAGQGTEADADRSRAELALRQNNVARSEEAVAVASARLAQVISLNGATTIRPVENAVTPIDLVPVGKRAAREFGNGAGKSAGAQRKSRPRGVGLRAAKPRKVCTARSEHVVGRIVRRFRRRNGRHGGRLQRSHRLRRGGRLANSQLGLWRASRPRIGVLPASSRRASGKFRSWIKSPEK